MVIFKFSLFFLFFNLHKISELNKKLKKIDKYIDLYAYQSPYSNHYANIVGGPDSSNYERNILKHFHWKSGKLPQSDNDNGEIKKVSTMG